MILDHRVGCQLSILFAPADGDLPMLSMKDASLEVNASAVELVIFAMSRVMNTVFPPPCARRFRSNSCSCQAKQASNAHIALFVIVLRAASDGHSKSFRRFSGDTPGESHLL
jgi:hypothetical protein